MRELYAGFSVLHDRRALLPAYRPEKIPLVIKIPPAWPRNAFVLDSIDKFPVSQIAGDWIRQHKRNKYLADREVGSGRRFFKSLGSQYRLETHAYRYWRSFNHPSAPLGGSQRRRSANQLVQKAEVDHAEIEHLYSMLWLWKRWRAISDVLPNTLCLRIINIRWCPKVQ